MLLLVTSCECCFAVVVLVHDLCSSFHPVLSREGGASCRLRSAASYRWRRRCGRSTATALPAVECNVLRLKLLVHLVWHRQPLPVPGLRAWDEGACLEDAWRAWLCSGAVRVLDGLGACRAVEGAVLNARRVGVGGGLSTLDADAWRASLDEAFCLCSCRGLKVDAAIVAALAAAVVCGMRGVVERAGGEVGDFGWADGCCDALDECVLGEWHLAVHFAVGDLFDELVLSLAVGHLCYDVEHSPCGSVQAT